MLYKFTDYFFFIYRKLSAAEKRPKKVLIKTVGAYTITLVISSVMADHNNGKIKQQLSNNCLSSHLISSQSLNLGDRRGTKHDITTIPFHLSMSSAALRKSPNPIPVHSLIIFSPLFYCMPLLFRLHSTIVFSIDNNVNIASPCSKTVHTKFFKPLSF